MRSGLGLLVLLMAAGCGHAPREVPTEPLLRDELFVAPPVPIEAGRVLAMSDAMRRYADGVLTGPSAPRDRRSALIDALYRRDGLLLGYDTQSTRTAAEAYEQRAGNCLSLVLMTASFARYLGLPVHFQRVRVDEEYSRVGDLFLAAGHVNVVVGRQGGLLDGRDTQWLTIDFLPQADLRGQRVEPIAEQTVLAMFMNNRAAEELMAGRVQDSYWWARAAVLQDPLFLPGINTLGVIYSRAQRPLEAERALRQVLAQDPDNLNALANLSRLLEGAGRASEAAVLSARLTELQPRPPFWFFDQGRAALLAGDYAAARDLFRQELRRQPNQHEVHFQLALAYHGLGDGAGAARHLGIALENSPTRGTQALYAGKLERLRAQRAH